MENFATAVNISAYLHNFSPLFRFGIANERMTRFLRVGSTFNVFLCRIMLQRDRTL